MFRVKFGPDKYRIFCVIYRPQSHKMKQFLPDLENLLNFLRSLNDHSMIFGDFNIDTIVKSKEMKDYENRLTAFDYRKQNILPTRVTPMSATCLDHVITSFSVSTETVITSFIDHYTVLGEITVSFENTKEKTTPKIWQKLRNIKIEKVLNFLFLLDQKLKNIKRESVLDLNPIALTIMECVDRKQFVTIKLMVLSGSQITSRTLFRNVTIIYEIVSTILRMKTDQHTNWQETV